ncbi:MAG: TIGR00282 family metallophosphoesterase, partial [Candidatus Muiribacteriaceae bacterium]
MRILFIGDVDDVPGLEAISEYLPFLKKKFLPDVVIVNGENAAKGLGLDKESADIIHGAGADVITLGNHTWSNKEIMKVIDEDEYNIIRPVNFPDNNPGKGYIIKEINGTKIAVINAHGQESIINVLGKEIFSQMDSPFHKMDEVLPDIKKETNLIFIDFHAESTIEKQAFAHYLDGKVSAVVCTHTHVTTADEKVLPGGTAYITDVGMTGASHGIAGCNPDEVITQYLTIRPTRWRGSVEKPEINGVVVDIDEKTGKSIDIFRVREIVDKDRINIRFTHEVFSEFLETLVNIQSLNKVANIFIEMLLNQTKVQSAGFFEKDSLQIIKRASTFTDKEEEKILEMLNKIEVKGNVRNHDILVTTAVDHENPEVKYNLVLKTERFVEFDHFTLDIFYSFYGRLRKEKLLVQTNDELSVLYEVGREISKTIELYGKDGLLD